MTAKPTTSLFDYGSRIAFYDELPKKGKLVLAIGESGCGKTYLCGTSPNPFVLDFDKGGETLRDLHIPHITFDWGEKIIDLTRMILIDARDDTGNFSGHPYETLCLDSITAFDKAAMKEMMEHPQNPKWKIKDSIWEKPEFDHWGGKKNYLVEINSILQDVAKNMNVIVTATVRVNDDPYTRKTKGLPEIEGSFRGEVGRFYDYVLHMEDTGKEYIANTRPKGIYIAKVRHKLPDVIVNPKFADLL